MVSLPCTQGRFMMGRRYVMLVIEVRHAPPSHPMEIEGDANPPAAIRDFGDGLSK
ncbi:hypothetical protein PI124_g21516 [Phytophthora idaei]|nr:hypothetical protein PI125_g23198 [Phytophthora idaei]KAG3131674.1 hypothetical protein PI126_g19957 [Phytophthora idaei]KAG3233413.1 hypothetical protein PI124_g21516 [Phytophthora idaei]